MRVKCKWNDACVAFSSSLAPVAPPRSNLRTGSTRVVCAYFARSRISPRTRTCPPRPRKVSLVSQSIIMTRILSRLNHPHRFRIINARNHRGNSKTEKEPTSGSRAGVGSRQILPRLRLNEDRGGVLIQWERRVNNEATSSGWRLRGRVANDGIDDKRASAGF
ncbi:hypothetical protein H6P81_004646 [Aristolochia fimbriata]|uniref:Uncharacterized protein n=1 Tax=Aristolochia fimbriata TaxID=158543 RepID=A0AAV7EVU2_ARIFI|nr:hypothetical protein H6P81_004646 [Aristolochia fimbriata]